MTCCVIASIDVSPLLKVKGEVRLATHTMVKSVSIWACSKRSSR